ncbi:MAG: hypothetical protein ACXW34_11830, partial [Nitrospira sp.]
MSADGSTKKGWLKIIFLLLLALGILGAYVGWYKFFRDEGIPDPCKPDNTLGETDGDFLTLFPLKAERGVTTGPWELVPKDP